jgi:thioredoxin reductase
VAHQKGNQVTLSYRKDAFSRIKERNVQRLPEYLKSGQLNVIFNSQPVEIREKSVLLDVAGQVRETGHHARRHRGGAARTPHGLTRDPHP